MPDTEAVIEICIEDAADATLATELGADRVELCRELWCGGLTPTDDQIEAAIRCAPPLGVRILVRDREEGFALTRTEVGSLTHDIRRLRTLTADSPVPVGFVVGSITAEKGGQVDLEAAARFREAAGNAALIFHRAFDQVENQLGALEDLVAAGFDGVLTTGGEGAACPASLRELVDASAGRIKIIASGGIRDHNIAQVLEETGATEVHMRAPLDPQARSGWGIRTDPDLVTRIITAAKGPRG